MLPLYRCLVMAHSKHKRRKRTQSPPALAHTDGAERERKGCLEKVPFASQAEANLVAASWGGRVKPYLCDFCGQWHMTST